MELNEAFLKSPEELRSISESVNTLPQWKHRRATKGWMTRQEKEVGQVEECQALHFLGPEQTSSQVGDHYPQQWFSSRGNFVPPRGHLVMFRDYNRIGGFYWTLEGQSQGCCKTFYNAQTAPTTRKYPTPNVISTKIEKLIWRNGPTTVEEENIDGFLFHKGPHSTLSFR